MGGLDLEKGSAKFEVWLEPEFESSPESGRLPSVSKAPAMILAFVGVLCFAHGQLEVCGELCANVRSVFFWMHLLLCVGHIYRQYRDGGRLPQLHQSVHEMLDEGVRLPAAQTHPRSTSTECSVQQSSIAQRKGAQYQVGEKLVQW